MQWGDRWITGLDAGPVILRNGQTGASLDAAQLCDTTGELVSAGKIRFTPDPGTADAEQSRG